jgi:hypothetical protein
MKLGFRYRKVLISPENLFLLTEEKQRRSKIKQCRILHNLLRSMTTKNLVAPGIEPGHLDL